MSGQLALDTERNEIVKPIVSIDDAIKAKKQFDDLCNRLLDKNDYQLIGNKPFKKKSAWRKLAQVFNLSDEILSADKTIREDKSFFWEFTVKAIAPNGRYTVATGSCDSKERNFAHVEHDVKATAHTRAKSRAISDLIGGGEVSAEELEFEDNRIANAKKVN